MPASPKARAVLLPIATLGELLSHGFEAEVWCPRCHTMRRPAIPAEKLRRNFAGARFRCRCGALGYPSFQPGPCAHKGQGDTLTDLYCSHCLPPWEIRDVRLARPPWSSVTLGKGQSFACPGCRRLILMHTRQEPPSAAPFAPWSHLSPISGRKL
jgi:hypothetical protein